jgi:hypothetical protein
MTFCPRTNKEHKMPGNPRDIIVSAEQRFPFRIRVGVPPDGFGQRYAQITAWLDENCGADNWAMTPSGMRGVINDGVNLFSRRKPQERLRRAVLYWLQSRNDRGRFRVRADGPVARTAASMHRTP